MMTCRYLLVMAISLSYGAGDVPGLAAEPQPNALSKSRVGSQVPPLTYHPPKLGAPKGRVGGGARGPDSGMLSLTVLAPDHPAQTIEEKPTLYWYASQAMNSPVEFTLMADDQIHPLLETRLADSVLPGLHKISLADYGPALGLSTTYRWYVTVVNDKDRRSRDLLAGGVIERVPLSDGLSDRLKIARAEEKPRLFAEAGIWYDAIAALSSLIETAPENSTLRTQRAMLLEQVGLLDVAAYDRTTVAAGGTK
jgi:hypothetical protein